MRSTFKIIAAGLLAITGYGLPGFHSPPVATPEAVREKLVLQADSFFKAVQGLQQAAARTGSKQILQQRFKAARMAYKRLEWATEYFDPLTSRLVNGPPVPETELNGQVIQPDVFFFDVAAVVCFRDWVAAEVIDKVRLSARVFGDPLAEGVVQV